jgi:hypothetical protein
MTMLTERPSFFPDKWRCLSGSALKLLAVITMLIDHIAATFLTHDRTVLFTVGSYTLTLYWALRLIGRLAFPIFCFLLTEGFVHTRDRRRYGLRLLAFAVVSEIPWDLWQSGKWFYAGQSVMVTLLLGFLGMWVIERFADKRLWQIGLLLALAAVSAVARADYGLSGFGLIVVMYALRRRPAEQAIAGLCLLPHRWAAGMAFIPINLYNGKRGFIHGRVFTCAFYAFYPVHILVLYLLKTYLF